MIKLTEKRSAVARHVAGTYIDSYDGKFWVVCCLSGGTELSGESHPTEAKALIEKAVIEEIVAEAWS